MLRETTMAKNNKEKYKIENEEYLEDKAQEEGVASLAQGILYEIINSGEENKRSREASCRYSIAEN